MKNSEAKIKKEMIALEMLFTVSIALIICLIFLAKYILAGVLILITSVVFGNIIGRKNLLINFNHFKKFSSDEITGQFEVAKPAANFSDDKKHGILLLHGFSASPQEFRFLIPMLKENNITFYAPRLTGFGIADVTKLEFVQSIQWLRDSLEAFDLLSQHVEEVSIVGHSMGGLLAVILSQQRKVKKLVLSAPYLVENKNHSFKKKLLKIPVVFCLMNLVLPVVKKSSFEENSDRFVYHAVPLHSIKALWGLHSLLNYSKIKNEMFLLSGNLDNTTNMKLNEEILAEKKISFQKYEFEKSGHNILEDIEREVVAKKIIDILKT